MTNIKLSEGSVDKNYVIEAILLEDLILRRLEALGVNEGTTIKIISKKKSGTLAVKVRGSRLAFGKHISENIEVKESIIDETA